MSEDVLSDEQVQRIFPSLNVHKATLAMVGRRVYRRDSDGLWRLIDDLRHADDSA